MRKNFRCGVAATAVAAAFIAPAFVTPAVASAADTIVTFSVTGGLIALVATPTTVLVVNGGNTAATGSIPLVTVTDARLGTTNWEATASSGSFVGTGGTTITASNVTYTPGAASKTGSVTVTSGSGGTLGAPVVAQTATAVKGLNTATWSPSISVALPTDATAGLYTGTITQSVA